MDYDNLKAQLMAVERERQVLVDDYVCMNVRIYVSTESFYL